MNNVYRFSIGSTEYRILEDRGGFAVMVKERGKDEYEADLSETVEIFDQQMKVDENLANWVLGWNVK